MHSGVREWTSCSFTLQARFNACILFGMAKTILQGTVKGARRRGRQKRWEDNIKELSGMGFGDSMRAAEDREGWKGIVTTSSVVPDDLQG